MPACLLLAAGASSRLGRPKQLLVFEGQALICRAAGAALEAGCTPVIAVTGAYQNDIAEALAGLPVRLQHNEQWDLGMGASIRCGIQYLQQLPSRPDAVLIMLSDQPFASAAHIGKLMEAYEQNRLMSASVYPGGNWGVPAIFHQDLWPLLAQLSGPQGAKAIIEAHKHLGSGIDFPDGQWDVDTEADWLLLQKKEKN